MMYNVLVGMSCQRLSGLGGGGAGGGAGGEGGDLQPWSMLSCSPNRMAPELANIVGLSIDIARTAPRDALKLTPGPPDTPV